MSLAWRNFSLDFSQKTFVMGILNVTPDSFSDGGRYFDTESAIKQALRMVEDGADIIDVGGESTRPGSDPVPIDEELKRTIPVIEILAQKIPVPISIDTYKADVAKKALEAGAAMVNDISGLRFDPAMKAVISAYKVPAVIMHMRGAPKDMQKNPVYTSLIPEIIEFLKESIAIAADAGIARDTIIIDPGIGFGKTFEHNLEIIHNLHIFSTLGKPVLIGLSRKAFIGKILGDLSPEERIEGTAAAAAISIFNGANIIRVHDVKEMVRIAKVADAVKNMKMPPPMQPGQGNEYQDELF